MGKKCTRREFHNSKSAVFVLGVFADCKVKRKPEIETCYQAVLTNDRVLPVMLQSDRIPVVKLDEQQHRPGTRNNQ